MTAAKFLPFGMASVVIALYVLCACQTNAQTCPAPSLKETSSASPVSYNNLALDVTFSSETMYYPSTRDEIVKIIQKAARRERGWICEMDRLSLVVRA